MVPESCDIGSHSCDLVAKSGRLSVRLRWTTVGPTRYVDLIVK